ncbi:hypothetical protein [Streptomyces beijiangensis]|uniref:Uncharacterized protein n=1 Tax=Streptomyces beijiangensis TaxID=163361 RepID=A0A939FA03_9ACTN|nr:hypothetical protein [Streptomyces beijiangensis]MBO0514792.1 hypothetical protein [Streptomyces beijiangensis]
MWNVVAPEVVLKNTVTDADGDASTLSFEVWTTDASGNAKARVSIDSTNQYGVGVSKPVASGATASFAVAYGKLTPGVTYTFHTSGFDGSLYETTWSPWAKFRINPYVTFPAPQASSTIDPVAQTEQEIFRSAPGGNLARTGAGKQNCSPADAQGRTLCISFSPPAKSAIKRAAAPSADVNDILPWCFNKTYGHDYMNRTDACLRDLGSANLIFASTDPADPPLGIASFNLEQRIKAYPNKAASGSDFAEFDQQLFVTPTHIDAALLGVNLAWNVGTVCKACDVSNVQWKTYRGNANDDGRWSSGEEGEEATQIANVQTKWLGTGKETIGLNWSLSGQVDVSDLKVTADLGSSGTAPNRELAVRCDDYLKPSTPGCVLPFFTPSYAVDTNLYPAAGAYYWLMQHKMPGFPGTGDAPLHYLGPDTTVMTSTTPPRPWTSSDSRNVVCPTAGANKWTAHASDAALGAQSCDEFAMGSTHESGGFPGGPNKVTSGDQCSQLFSDKSGSGFGVFADTRKATAGPTWKEKCGRAAIPLAQNTGAFHELPAPSWRMLDNDPFYVSNPGFEHCTNANTTCAWKKIG